MEDFAGKVILVTGAASGIGRVTAELLAAAGGKVVATDVSPAGEEVVQAINAGGGTAAFMRADITSEAEVAATVAFAVDTYGGLDCAANCAGVGSIPVEVAEVSVDEWRRVLSVDLDGTFYCMKHEIRAMLATGRKGSLVNLCAAVGATALPYMGPYVAAKHGVAGLTKAAALDYAKRGVRVNAVMPGIVDTPMLRNAVADFAMDGFIEQAVAMHPIGRVGEPHEVAQIIGWLLSDAASFVTGATYFVDGGNSAI